MKIAALIVLTAGLTLPVASCDRSASAQSADPGLVLDIESNPDILLSIQPAANLKLNGVKLGDDISVIPANLIKFKQDDRLDCTNCSYTIINGKVWSMTLTDRKMLNQLQVPQDDPDLIQMRLGKADQIESADADNKKAWKGYWFSSKRSAVFLSDDQFTGWVSVTICR